jgi:hypothetical protein
LSLEVVLSTVLLMVGGLLMVGDEPQVA